MKGFKRILLIFLILVLCFGIVGFLKLKSESNKAINSIQISTVNLTFVDDGSYFGKYSSGPCSAKVKVCVKNHKIEKISLLEHKNGMGSKAETIVDNVVDRQTLDVDTVSGATISSKVILKSTENALLKGEN